MRLLIKIVIKSIIIKLSGYSERYSVNIFLIPIYFFNGSILVLFQLILSLFKKVNFYYLDTKRIGHFVVQGSIFVNTIEKNSINIFCPDKIICNEFLYKKIKKKLFFLNRQFVLPIIIFSDFLNHFLPLKLKINHNYVLNRKHKMEFLNKLNKKPFINFSISENKFGEKIMKEKFGLNKKDKFICVIVRDEYYLKKLENKLDLTHNDTNDHYRNYDLKKFIPSFKSMERKGYHIFRMGKFSNKKLNIKNKKIIDYVNSKYRSDFMDIYLIKNCKFMISTNTGLDFIAYLFKKKIGYLNLCVGFINFLRDNIYLPSNFIFKKNKRRLSLRELFEFNVAANLDSLNFKKNKVQPTHNTPYEIKNFLLEVEKDSRSVKIKKITKNQKKFWNIFINNYLNLKYGKIVFKNKNFVNKSFISDSYLSKNSKWFLK